MKAPEKKANNILVDDHLYQKSEITVALYQCLVQEFENIGSVKVQAMKSMICFSAGRNFAYVIQLGRNFVDLVIPFKEAHVDNLCFQKIKAVPGSDDFNHHIRIYTKEDFNDEVKGYMKKAFDLAKKKSDVML